jgi:hypothetical protein
MSTTKKRMTIYLTQASFDKIENYAHEVGISRSSAVQLAVLAGIESVSLSVNPDWKAYFEKIILEGKPFTLPDGSIFESGIAVNKIIDEVKDEKKQTRATNRKSSPKPV